MMHWSRIIALSLVCAFLVPPPMLHGAWVANGVAICTVTNAQDTPTIASDGASGAIIIWRDYRTANTDIYAQRIDAAGNLLWTGTGMPVCTMTGAQSLPLAIPDGAGGVIVAWQDFRSGNTTDIYAQRVNSSGYVQWTANGLPFCAGMTGLSLSQVIPDGAGGALIAWSDTRNASNDIFIQRIDSNGAALWTANGVTVCAASLSQVTPAVASDGAGGAIIAWRDSRNGASDIYAQRLNAAGAAQWTADGIVICNAAQAQLGAQILSDGSGGAFIAWTDHRNTVDDDIYAQRVDGNGVPQWTANGIGIVSSMTGKQSDSRIVAGAASEAIIAWLDLRSGSTEDIYAQKVDTAGTVQWTANGVPVCTAVNRQIAMQLIPNGSGGAVATWQDERGSSGVWDIYAQRINGDGTMGWAANGIVVSAAALNQTAPQLAPDGVGGATIVWKDERGGNADIYAQRVDAAGHTVTATLLRDYSVVASADAVEIEWTLSEAGENVRFLVLRGEGASGSLAEIAAGPSGGSGVEAIAGNSLSFRYTDETCVPGESYRYRVDALDGGARIVLFETGEIKAPGLRFALLQNYPNPFNPSTTIRFVLREAGPVALEVFDVNGKLVRRLESDRLPAGTHAVEWDGRDGRGVRSSTGIYFYRLRAGKETLSRKMILLR